MAPRWMACLRKSAWAAPQGCRPGRGRGSKGAHARGARFRRYGERLYFRRRVRGWCARRRARLCVWRCVRRCGWWRARLYAQRLHSRCCRWRRHVRPCAWRRHARPGFSEGRSRRRSRRRARWCRGAVVSPAGVRRGDLHQRGGQTRPRGGGARGPGRARPLPERRLRAPGAHMGKPRGRPVPLAAAAPARAACAASHVEPGGWPCRARGSRCACRRCACRAHSHQVAQRRGGCGRGWCCGSVGARPQNR